ncbi:hypothetical protein A1S_3672 [Acinetobacter baumannii ATCC 17978]|nr:hypothetical protein A1S_3672 [Acinetobacter baumannii ATCC 17978]
MQDQLIDLLITGTVDTLLMVGASAFIAFFNWLTYRCYFSQYF